MAITYVKAFAVLGYTFEADMHCLGCTAARFGDAVLEDGFEGVDSEGNPPHPIFACDSALTDACGTCHEPLWG